MNTPKNLHDVSAIYFFIIAFVYVFASLALRNGFITEIATFIMRILDVPFALIGLLYGGSTLYLQLSGKEDENVSPWIMVLFTVCLMIFAFIVFMSFAFPSKL